MKKIRTFESNEDLDDDMLPEYRLDYSKARRNPQAIKTDTDRLTIVLDSDVAKVFVTAESVNNVLRALIKTMPHQEKPASSERLAA
jgi:hypothetical protein